MMYLSRLILNPRSGAVRRDLGSHRVLHSTVCSFFPELPLGLPAGTDARQHFGVLHRLDSDQRSGRLTLLVQSRDKPDFSGLPADYLLPPAELPGVDSNPDCKPIRDTYAAVLAGTRLVFRLRANPTKRVATKRGADGTWTAGKRVEIRGDGELEAWLRRKAESAGFALLSVRTLPAGRTASVSSSLRARGHSDRGLTFAAVIFEGLLEVTDPEAFRGALEQGIGSGKAYGFGLLSVAPAHTAARIPTADAGSYPAARTVALVG